MGLKMLALVQGTTIPSSRFRVGQLLPYWRERGVEVEVVAGYGDRYNEAARASWGPLYKLGCRLRRVAGSLDAGRYDVVFVQRPALPQTPLPEQLVAALNPRMIFDFDDHIGMGAGGQISAARQHTLEACVRSAARAIAGNHFLARLGGQPGRTEVIPTVIDARRYAPAPRSGAAGEVVIGWMGTASNFGALRAIVGELEEALDRWPQARVRIVSNGRFAPLEGRERVEQIAWSAAREVELLQSFDIGLMPLEDTLANQGKCGFKMLQYMSVGAPVVVSAVGANVELFEGSGAGFCLRDGERWVDALGALIEDEAERRHMGEAARAHVAARYSAQGVVERYIDLFEQVASS